MYIPYSMHAWFALLGAAMMNVCGFAATAVSMRRVHDVGFSSYAHVFMQGALVWSGIGVLTGICLVFASKSLEGHYGLNNIGVSEIRKQVFYVGLLTWTVCAPIKWLFAIPGVLEPRSLLFCLGISFVASSVVVMATQNIYLAASQWKAQRSVWPQL